MPKLSGEATFGLVMEIVLVILDHLHIREPLLIWGLFIFGLALITDSVVRSKWVFEAEKGSRRRKRRILGMIPVVIAFTVFGGWIYARGRSESTAPPQANLAASPREPEKQPDQPSGKIPPVITPTPSNVPAAKKPKSNAATNKPTVSTTGDESPAVGGITQGSGSALSFNQQGGITAGTVNAAVPFRQLTEVQKEGIANFIQTMPKSVMVAIGGVYGSGDAVDYAGQFFPLFDGRHLDGQTTPAIRTGFSAAYMDVMVGTRSDEDSASEYRNAMVDRLISLGIPAIRANGSKVAPGNLEIIVGFRPAEVKPEPQ